MLGHHLLDKLESSDLVHDISNGLIYIYGCVITFLAAPIADVTLWWRAFRDIRLLAFRWTTAIDRCSTRIPISLCSCIPDKLLFLSPVASIRDLLGHLRLLLSPLICAELEHCRDFFLLCLGAIHIRQSIRAFIWLIRGC